MFSANITNSKKIKLSKLANDNDERSNFMQEVLNLKGEFKAYEDIEIVNKLIEEIQNFENQLVNNQNKSTLSKDDYVAWNLYYEAIGMAGYFLRNAKYNDKYELDEGRKKDVELLTRSIMFASAVTTPKPKQTPVDFSEGAKIATDINNRIQERLAEEGISNIDDQKRRMAYLAAFGIIVAIAALTSLAVTVFTAGAGTPIALLVSIFIITAFLGAVPAGIGIGLYGNINDKKKATIGPQESIHGFFKAAKKHGEKVQKNVRPEGPKK